MKRKIYISTILQVLFIASFLLRLFPGIECSCDDHNHQAKVHVCCTCSHHAADCAHHDKAFDVAKCQAHHSLDDVTIDEGFTSSKQSKVSTSYTQILLFAIIQGFSTTESLPENSIEQRIFDPFSSITWSARCKGLRAPPVLV